MAREECKNCPIVEELRNEIAKLTARIEELEKFPKNSGNSSLPPSSDKKPNKYSSREKTGKRAGGQPGHKGHTKTLIDNPDEIVELYPQQCQCCGGYHFIKMEAILEQRQVIDIPPIKPQVLEYQQKAAICTTCGERNVGQFPENIAPNIQIGDRASAIIGYLNIQHHVSYERITQFFNDIFNFPISKGTVDNKLKVIAHELEPTYWNILEILKKSGVVCSDETGLRINGKNANQWVFTNDDVTFYKNDRSRGFKVIEGLFGKVFEGSWISDRYGAQLKIEAEHQFCLAHLLRDCQYAIESEKSEFARDLKDLFLRAIEYRREKGNNFELLEIETFREIHRLKDELAEIFAKPPPNLKENEKKLYKQLHFRQKELLHFLDNPDVPYDNNISERALRNQVVHRKVSGCFRSDEGANTHDVIASVMETAKKQCIGVLDTLNMPWLLNQYLLQG